jgi:predicted nucleic acid-binding Zn ribbon protein
MPCYIFECAACSEHTTLFLSVAERKNAPSCGKCGGVMERDYHSEHSGHVPGSAWPLTTTHLNSEGKPETFNSAADLERACKERGLRHRPDSAFVEQSMEMERFRTADGRWDMRAVYKEGRGDGEQKRRWI